jgi:hypothetical protein
MAPKENHPKKSSKISSVVRRQMQSGIVVHEDGKYRFCGEKRSKPASARTARWINCRTKKGKD